MADCFHIDSGGVDTATCAEAGRDPLVTRFRPLAPPSMSAVRHNYARVQTTGAQHLLLPKWVIVLNQNLGKSQTVSVCGN